MSSSNQSRDRSIVSPQAIQAVQIYLAQFAATDDFESKIETAFGTKIGSAAIRQQWLSGDFSLVPEIRVLSNGELGTANGAYAASLDEILVSSDFLASHEGDVNAVAELLLEEIGHKIDVVLNGSVDSPGDEGNIFRLLATGYSLSAATLAGLRTQDDHGVITVDGQSVAVENQDFTGTDGNDTLIWTAGDDKFYPLKGADSIDGGAGNDRLYIKDSTDTQIAINYTTPTNGTITGGSNNGTTFKNIESVDIFFTGSGNYNNYINFSAASGGSTVYSGYGNDTIVGGAGDDKFYPEKGADSIDGGAGNDSLSLGNSYFYDTADTTINYTTPIGMVTGGFSDGTTFSNIERIEITTGSGNDYINVSATSGGASTSTGEGNDTLIGGAGDDAFSSGGGNDTLIGGAGNDTFSFGDKDSGAKSIDGGVGNDRLTINTNSNYDLAITLNYTTPTNGTITTGFWKGTTFQNIEIFQLYTSASDDYINVSAASGNSYIYTARGNDTLIGGTGDDSLFGGQGNDNLTGGGGADKLYGDDGNDTYTIIVDGTLGNRTVIDDSSGTNDTLTLSGATPTIKDISRYETTLFINLNQDGVSTSANKFLAINNFFANTTGNAKGTGFIENLAGLSSSLVLNMSTRNDFDGDSKSDILWRNTDGSVALWQMNSSTVTPGSIAALTADWSIAGTGDFNSDKNADLLLSNTDGRVVTWQMNGAAVTAAKQIGTISTGWSISGTGDFNGDGTADIAFSNTNGVVAIWQMNGSTVTAAKTIGTLGAGWSIAGTGDFNGDGTADLLLTNTNGSIAEWQMGGAVVAAKTVGTLGAGWSIAGTGDFNGDGKADLLLRNTNGSVAEWQMNGEVVTATSTIGSTTADWKIAGTGDFNGDKNADILWRNDNGGVATWQLDGSKVLTAGATSIPSSAIGWQIAAPIL